MHKTKKKHGALALRSSATDQISSWVIDLFATETGQAHDNSADSEMLQVLANGMCTHISFFVSKTVREIRACFLSVPKIQLKRVNHTLRQRTID